MTEWMVIGLWAVVWLLSVSLLAGIGFTVGAAIGLRFLIWMDERHHPDLDTQPIGDVLYVGTMDLGDSATVAGTCPGEPLPTVADALERCRASHDDLVVVVGDRP